MTTQISQPDLLRELEQVVEAELNRHLGVAKEWFPHDYIPWTDGRNYDGLMGGDPWSPDDADIPEVARTALIVNLLTEDNLPSYHHEIAVLF
ncbi:MAG: acyl-ACP desaturase, partial [Nocardioidaceae bacterium]|nr:acyl-ACP desaturase [Nocardioidaceae bacterium]